MLQKLIRRLLFVSVLLAGLTAAPAGAAPFADSIPLPVDFQPEGIAVGTDATFYVGSFHGDIYRGDLRSGTGAVWVDAPPGRVALGMKVDEAHHLLFVAGGATGAAFVYDTRTAATVATYQFATGPSLLNDVALTGDAAYFNGTLAPVLYKIPISPDGRLGSGTTLPLSGPAATTTGFGLNGTSATPDGSVLITNHTSLGALFTIDPATGVSKEIHVDGLLPGTLDGLLLAGPDVWVVENFANTLVRVRLSSDRSSGTITSTITSPLFHVPTTVARFGDQLALVNGRFNLGLPAPPGTTFDVVLVRAR